VAVTKTIKESQYFGRPLFENTLSTGADEAGMQNDSKSDLRSGY